MSLDAVLNAEERKQSSNRYNILYTYAIIHASQYGDEIWACIIQVISAAEVWAKNSGQF